MYGLPNYVNDQNCSWEKIVTCAAMTQLVGIQSLWIPMWQVIMIRHKKWQLEDLD
jgi:hypothetical protein